MLHAFPYHLHNPVCMYGIVGLCHHRQLIFTLTCCNFSCVILVQNVVDNTHIGIHLCFISVASYKNHHVDKGACSHCSIYFLLCLSKPGGPKNTVHWTRWYGVTHYRKVTASYFSIASSSSTVLLFKSLSCASAIFWSLLERLVRKDFHPESL